MSRNFSRRSFFKSSLMLAASGAGLQTYASLKNLTPVSEQYEKRTVFVVSEATGISPDQGHRLIELGIVEMINGAFTGKTFHCYFNPDREIDEGAQTVHGIDRNWLDAMPKFEQFANQLSELISGALIVTIREPFSESFLDAEFSRLGLPAVSEISTGSTETWAMAKRLWPNQACSMNDVLERLEIRSNWKDALTGAVQIALAYEGMQKLAG
jgi:DNA polymerase-3 subunit epsilon